MGHERFFLDHGAIHDRVTGQHVGMQAEIDWQPRLLNLLEGMHQKCIAAEKAKALTLDSLTQFLNNWVASGSRDAYGELCQGVHNWIAEQSAKSAPPLAESVGDVANKAAFEIRDMLGHISPRFPSDAEIAAIIRRHMGKP